MSLNKKPRAGSWACIITLIFAIASVIIYNINIHGEGYFKNAAVPNATKYVIIGICLLAVAFAVSLVTMKGIGGRIFTILSDVMRIVVPALMIAAMITIVSARVEGFAFIYFSNEEVLQEVQTAANMSSAHGAIANIAALAVTAVVGMIAAFLSTNKKEA